MLEQLGKFTYELFNTPRGAHMADNFSRSLKIVLAHEGGYVNHPSDPGGITNLGITKKVMESWVGRSVTEQEMRSLTVEQVRPIYLERYWNRLGCDLLPAGLDLVVFDFGVNAGTRRSARMLQNIVGATADGDIGDVTRSLLEQYATTNGVSSVIRQFSQDRRDYYRSLGTFPVFGRGWLRRTDEVEAKALSWASGQ